MLLSKDCCAASWMRACLNTIGCLRGQTSLIEQLCLNEPPQALLQCGFVYGRDRLQQLVGKASTDRRPQLCDQFPCPQPIQPRH